MIRYYSSKDFPSSSKNPVVAFGNYDGVHLGHQELIRTAIKEAKRLGSQSVIYTFDPHPVRVLAPKSCPLQLQTLEQRLESLELYGADAVIVEPFTHELAQMPAEDFFEEVIVGRIGAKVLVAGYDFTFGLHRQGTIDMLEELGSKHDITVEKIKAQFAGETLVSSTNIRTLVVNGEIEKAGELLGRQYLIRGIIVSGRGIGGTLHAHTANMETRNEIIPKNGVYITQTKVWDAQKNSDGHKKPYNSITSIGDNPTFPEAGFSIETHLIDVDVNVRGHTADIRFIKRVRDQLAFESADALSKQIERDIDEARKFHKQHQS